MLTEIKVVSPPATELALATIKIKMAGAVLLFW